MSIIDLAIVGIGTGLVIGSAIVKDAPIKKRVTALVTGFAIVATSLAVQQATRSDPPAVSQPGPAGDPS